MARRGAGEGSIYRRKDGRWAGAITTSADGGRKVYYGKTRKEVADKISAALEAHAKGMLPKGRPSTVAVFLDRWLDHERERVRPKTWTHYRWLVGLAKESIGRVRLDKLTAEDADKMLRQAGRSGLSSRSVHHLRSVVRNALNQAVRWDLIPRNPMLLTEPVRVRSTTEAVYLEPKDAPAVLEAVAGDPQLEPIVTLALGLGLRQGEILGLQWGDLDTAGELHVRRQVQRVPRLQDDDGPRTEIRVVDLKTKQSRRDLPLPAFVADALQRHRERLVAAGVLPLSTSLVFVNRNGRPVDGVEVTRSFQAALERAGLPTMRFHDLRHSAASLLHAQGVPPKVAQAILGHSTVTTTLAIYTHLTKDLNREAADALDRVFARRR